MKHLTNNKGFGLLTILFVLAIIGLIYLFATKAGKDTTAAKDGYFKQTSLDASNYKNTLDNTKKILNDAVATRSQSFE